MTDRIETDDAEARLIKAGFECHRAGNHHWLYATDLIGTSRLNIDKGTVNAAHVIALLAGKGFDANGNRPPIKTYGAQNIQGVIDLFEMRATVAARGEQNASGKIARESYLSEKLTWRAAADILRQTEFIGWKQSP